MVNKDQVEGVGKQIKGAVKDAVGGATSDAGLQAEGKLDKVAGKVQKGLGDAVEDVKDADRR